eukprot:2642472-Rhodomonas_salina.4
MLRPSPVHYLHTSPDIANAGSHKRVSHAPTRPAVGTIILGPYAFVRHKLVALMHRRQTMLGCCARPGNDLSQARMTFHRLGSLPARFWHRGVVLRDIASTCQR